MVESNLEYALKYAAISWLVLPLHEIIDGRCSCGKSKCKSPGKHPREHNGLNSATLDTDLIKKYWKKHPNANIGIRTGKISGIWVLDVDVKSGGIDTLDELMDIHSGLPCTVMAKTGSGGFHYVFKYPSEIDVGCKVGLWRGIDVRGNGGYIVVEPSKNALGPYDFDSESHPLHGVVPNHAPPWVLQKLSNKKELPVNPGNKDAISKDEVLRIRAALFYIQADDRDEWLKVGMALHSTNAGNQAFGLWCEWSCQSDKYDLKQQRYTWNSFGKTTSGSSVQLGSLFKMAKDCGYIQLKIPGPEEPPIDIYENDPELNNSEKTEKQTHKKQKKACPKITDDVTGRFIFISTRNRIFDTATSEEMTREGFDGLMLHKHSNPKASTLLLSQKKCIKVQNLIYLPGEKENPLLRGASKIWNIWNDPNVEMPDFSKAVDIELWLRHLNYLYPCPKEQAHILNWMAWCLQYPGIKINHALCLMGVTRIGKDMLLNPLRYGLGERNVCEPPATELKENFTDYLHHAKLVIFQEIMNFEGLNLENKLKVMLAAPPDMLRVRMFGTGFYETPNIVQAIFMSNYKDALHISPGDGRYFAVWSDVQPLSAEYYSDLWKWLDGPGCGLVVRWLLDRDLSNFNPKEPAPMTDFKNDLIKTSHSPLKHQLLDMIDSMDYPFNVDCVRSSDVNKALRDKYSAKAIGSVLSEIGCINKGCKRSSGVRSKVSLFAIRNIKQWSDRSAKLWLIEYDSRTNRSYLDEVPA